MPDNERLLTEEERKTFGCHTRKVDGNEVIKALKNQPLVIPVTGILTAQDAKTREATAREIFTWLSSFYFGITPGSHINKYEIPRDKLTEFKSRYLKDGK